jgi:hypothetical protein
MGREEGDDAAEVGGAPVDITGDKEATEEEREEARPRRRHFHFGPERGLYVRIF